MKPDATTELLDVSARLLRTIQDGDWKAYAELCDPTITAFEPEAPGTWSKGWSSTVSISTWKKCGQ